MSSSRDLGPRPGRHPGLRGLTPATLATAAILVIRIVLYGVGDAGAPSLRAGVEELRAAHLGLFGLGVGLGLFWLYRAWARVPEAARRTYDGRRVSPADAVWGLLAPVYNLYWMFIANVGLCGAVENHARLRGVRKQAPSSLAMVACIVQLIPVVGLVVGPLVWFAFMVRMDLLQSTLDD